MPQRPNTYFATQELAASSVRTVNGNSGDFTGYGPASSLRVQLDVTAFTGTSPTLDCVVEDSIDGVNWNVIGTFAQKIGVGREVINVTTLFSDRIRARWTLGGTTPSFTFSVVAASQTPAT